MQKNLSQKISPTERTALFAGNISIERDIISGTPNLKSYIQNYSYQNLNIPKDFNKKLNKFCLELDDNKIMEEKKIPQNIFDMIKEYKLFGLNIQKNMAG